MNLVNPKGVKIHQKALGDCVCICELEMNLDLSADWGSGFGGCGCWCVETAQFTIHDEARFQLP